jgi:hypothetical protein
MDLAISTLIKDGGNELVYNLNRWPVLEQVNAHLRHGEPIQQQASHLEHLTSCVTLFRCSTNGIHAAPGLKLPEVAEELRMYARARP